MMIKTTLRGTFDGVRELAQWIDSNPRQPGAGDSSQSRDARKGWDMGMGMDGAMSMGLSGGFWAQGATDLQKARVEIDRMTHRAPALERVRSVAGYAPCIPSHLAGLPEAMWTDGEPEDAPRARSKVLRIGVAASYSAQATQKHVTNRGAAIMSIVDSLENDGFRVEVNAVILAVDERYAPYRWDVVLKSADQDWSPGACAFALAHPAFNRRLAFALKERDPLAYPNTQSGGYNSVEANYVSGEDYDLWVPRLGGNIGEYGTPERASVAAKQAIASIVMREAA
jgi:hypothetical protein